MGPGVLRDRDGRGARGPALRRHAPRRHPVPREPAPGRPHRHLGHRHRQDGSRDQAALRADARPQVRHLHGIVRQLRRSLLGLVLGHQGCRPDHPGRRLRARLSAPARGVHPGNRVVAAADHERRPGRALARGDRGSRSSLADSTPPSKKKPLRNCASRRPSALRVLARPSCGDAIIDHGAAFGDVVVRVRPRRAGAGRAQVLHARSSAATTSRSSPASTGCPRRRSPRKVRATRPLPRSRRRQTYGVAGSDGRYQLFAVVESTRRKSRRGRS